MPIFSKSKKTASVRSPSVCRFAFIRFLSEVAYRGSLQRVEELFRLLGGRGGRVLLDNRVQLVDVGLAVVFSLGEEPGGAGPVVGGPVVRRGRLRDGVLARRGLVFHRRLRG